MWVCFAASLLRMKCFAWIYLQARRSHATVPTIPDPKRRMLPGSGVVPEPAESRTVNDSNPIVPVDWNACEGATRLNVLERSLHVGPRTFITTPLRSKGLEFGLSCSCILKYASSRGRGNVVIPKGFPRSVGRVESRLLGFPCFPHSVISNGLLWKRVSQNHNHREGHADRTASSDSRRTVLVQKCFPLPPIAEVSGMDPR